MPSASEARGGGRSSRISISIPDELLERLRTLAREQGRSLSNLCALMLESGANGNHPKP